MRAPRRGRQSESTLTSLPYLREVSLKADPALPLQRYPFRVPAVKNLGTLRFAPDVTFLVGENGTGKSTLLEAIAVAIGMNAEGGSRNFNFSTRESHSALWQSLRLARSWARPRDHYFLRAESFYNVATAIDDLGVGGAYGGMSLHSQSHGESFFALMMKRFRGHGRYLLDEPEAALSPQRQIQMLARMRQVSYTQPANYRLFKAFLDDPEEGIRQAFSRPDTETG